jgi:molybdate/tungstate transport system substrate-binding protein
MLRWTLSALAAWAALGGSACKPAGKDQAVVVFAAASLARAFSDLKLEVEKEPGLQVLLSLGGSQEACRKVSELGHRADVVATADHRVIDQILRPRHAVFTIRFATNELVLAHLQHSKFTEEVSATNWFNVLLRPGVRLGMASPDLAPLGYATLLVWQLAELHEGKHRVGHNLAARLRDRCAPEHVAPDEGELLQLLQSRAIDYAFMYRSTAEEHNLKLVELPARYSLGAVEQAAFYARAAVRVRMDRPRRVTGAPLVYGVTVPSSAPHPGAAALFLQKLLGPAGQRSLRRTGFRPLVPARCDRPAMAPEALRPLIR